MRHYPPTDYTNQRVQDHTINHHCHENLKSLQKPVQSIINKPALLEVQTVSKSSVWNLNNKNGASLLKAALLLMPSVLTLQAVFCHLNFTLHYPLDRFGSPQMWFE
jgi:hypothetical protein